MAKLGCMTIVAARFKPEPADCSAEYLPKELSRRYEGTAAKRVEDVENDDSIEKPAAARNVCVHRQGKAVTSVVRVLQGRHRLPASR